MNLNPISSRECELISPLISEELQRREDSTLLDTIEIIARNALEGLKAYQGKQLSLLDPDIGDEACQLRALMILQMDAQNIGEEIIAGQQQLEKLCNTISKIRGLWAELEYKLEQQKTAVDNQLLILRQRKIQLNAEKDQKLSKVPKGSEENKKIWKEFQESMKLFSQENEAPLKQQILQWEMEISDQKIEILKKEPLEAKLSKNTRQVILCYLIHKTSCKIYQKANGLTSYRNGMKINKLQFNELNLDGRLFEKLLHNAKVIVNSESMGFLIEESKKLEGKRARIIQLSLQSPLKSAKDELKEYSFYHGCELVIRRIMQMGFPILIKSRKPEDSPENFSCQQLYMPMRADSQNKIKYMPSIYIQKHQPVLVIEGISAKAQNEGLSKIIDACGGIMKIVRLNLAQHRFCTSQAQADHTILQTISSDLREETQKISQEKQRAIKEGYSQVNPSNYMIDHIYADYI